MIPVLFAIAVTIVAGAAVARAIDADAPIGLFHLYGCGAMALALLFLPWSRLTVMAIVVVSIAVLAIRRPQPKLSVRFSPVDVVTLLVLTSFAVFATLSALWEWDSWAIWALKARVFVEYRGIDWPFLENAAISFDHPDYPPLVPLNMALPAVIGGVWDDRWLGLFAVAILASATLAVREITAREFPPLVSAAIALALAGLGASRYVGTAETALIAFAVAALAFLRAGRLRHAALLLGFAALTKNEGLALVASAFMALLIMRRMRDALRLWPAIAIAAPWLLLRAIHGLGTDFFSGSLLERVTAHVPDAGRILGLLAVHADRPWLWMAIVLAGVAAIRRERLLFVVIALQLILCMAVYFATQHDVSWHISTSWDRVSRQLAAMAAFAALTALAARPESPPSGPGDATASR